MSSEPDAFGKALGSSFQGYIGEVLRRSVSNCKLSVLGEEKYGTKKRPEATCDWMLVEGIEAAAYIECKSKRLRLDARMAVGTALDDELGKLADGIVQLYKTLKDHKDGRYPNLEFVSGRKQFPIVVTLEEWYLFGEPTLKKLRDAVRNRMIAQDLSQEWLTNSPYSVMSINEFESAVHIIDQVGVAAFFEGKLRESEYCAWTYENYMRERWRDKWVQCRSIFNKNGEDLFDQFLADETQAGAANTTDPLVDA
jgi:hypothetical protein